MCTALALCRQKRWFCRTLDIETPYGETVVLAPRLFRHLGCDGTQLAMLGMAHLYSGAPLYYDAMNECGLAMAALRFPEYAVYHPKGEGKESVASFALIPRVLGSCRSIEEAKETLLGLTVTDEGVSSELLPTPLHWMISDGRRALAVEPLEGGLSVCDAKYGVLTNAPPILRQNENPHLKILEGEDAAGLPGDFSSPSRYVRMAYIAQSAREIDTPDKCFSLMDCVSVPEGAATGIDGRPIFTRYTACMDLSAGRYFFATATHRAPREVDLRDGNLETAELFCTRL